MNPIQNRIFIIPIGYNPVRAKQKPTNPDQVYLVTQHHDPDQEKIDKFRNVVEDVNQFFNFAHPTIFGIDDFFNIFELMSIFRHICEMHPKDQIFINVGSGSKLTAMAGFMVSGWFDNVTCFYPKIRITLDANKDQSYIENKIEDIQMLESFPVKKLDNELIPVLNFLQQENRSKKEILEKLIDINQILLYFQDEQGDRKERSPQSLYNLLKRNYLNPLEEEEFIEETSNGEVSLTRRGENMQLIFGKSDFYFENI